MRQAYQVLGAMGLMLGAFGCAVPDSAPVSTVASQQTHLERLTVSPRLDSWATAEWRGGGKVALLLHDLAGNRRVLAEVARMPSVMRWSGDGKTLVYSEHLTRVIPGQFSDWDVPATETLGFRLMAVPTEGGEPRVIKESPLSLTPVAAPLGAFVAYVVGGSPEDLPRLIDASQWKPLAPSALHLIDLESGQDEDLGPVGYMPNVKWSPDGTQAAYLSRRLGQSDTGLIVLDRRTRERKTLVPGDVQQYFWTARGISYVQNTNWRRLTHDPLDGRPLEEIGIPLGFFPRSSPDGWYVPSPDGDKLLAYKASLEGGFGVYDITAKRFVELSQQIGTGNYVHWHDNDHLLLIPAAITGKATIVKVEVEPLDCAPPASIHFEWPIRRMGAQNPEWAQTIEAPYVGGPYRYELNLPGHPSQHHGVVTFRAAQDGLYSILTSSDVPVRVLAGSLFGTTISGAPQALERVAVDGYVRQDVQLSAGDYTLELGPSPVRDVTIAIPQAPDPVCIEKGLAYP